MFSCSNKTFSSRFQEVFAKKDNRAKDIKTSTHLICPSAEGDKYRAAVKWGVPAVTRDWLIECIHTGEREPEDLYKVDNKNRREVNYKEVIRSLIMKGGGYNFYFEGFVGLWGWEVKNSNYQKTNHKDGIRVLP